MNNTSKNDITGDLIKSKTNNSAYADGYDRIFGKKKITEKHDSDETTKQSLVSEKKE